MKKLLGLGLLGTLLVVFSLSLLGDSGSTRFVVPPVSLTDDLQAMPSTPTNLTSTDTYIFQLTVSNTTGGALTITISDRATSAKALFTTVSIAANSTQIYSFPEGVKMKGGITWSASNTGLVASIKAKRIPT